MGLDPHVLARGEGAVVICLAKGLKMSACADHSFMLFFCHNCTRKPTHSTAKIVTRHIPRLTFAAGGPADG